MSFARAGMVAQIDAAAATEVAVKRKHVEIAGMPSSRLPIKQKLPTAA
jgi:hypothetical protein